MSNKLTTYLDRHRRAVQLKQLGILKELAEQLYAFCKIYAVCNAFVDCQPQLNRVFHCDIAVFIIKRVQVFFADENEE